MDKSMGISYGFVPDFDDPVLGRASSLPPEHAVQREAGGRRTARRESDFFAAAVTAGKC